MKPHMEDAPRWAKFLAQDEDGTWHWFETKPYAIDGVWHRRSYDDRTEYAHPHETLWYETCEEIK